LHRRGARWPTLGAEGGDRILLRFDLKAAELVARDKLLAQKPVLGTAFLND
jgi:hypothetical protein